ncbi:MAG: hypothetical protein H6562_05220 [Lewinellaceae bacterium]|nr:hypothetical protein [Lewinellaceae bacterium]
MAIEIGAYIAELLYEHEKVAVPGLGGFIKVYQHAVVDHVQEQIFPPTEEVKFNPNLAFDDGLLINKIVEDHGLSVEEAEKEIQGFVNELKEAADRREIIVLPGVGRLYRSGESQLNLLSDHQNFSTQLFGLAPAKALPVAKIEFIPTDSGISSSAGKKPAVMPWTVRLTTWANRHLWLVLGIAAVAILATAWILFREPESQLSSALNPPEDRLNVRPSDPPAAAEPEPGTGNAEENQQQASGATDDEDDDTEAPSLAPGQKECRIRIGKFGSESNVKKLVEKLYDAGFEPYTRPAGSLTEVGVQFAYETQADIDKKLKLVQSRFEKKAVVAEQ